MLVMVKRWKSWAPRGTLPKSWAVPSLNILSAQLVGAGAGVGTVSGAWAGAAAAPSVRAARVSSAFLIRLPPPSGLPVPRAPWEPPANSIVAVKNGEGGIAGRRGGIIGRVYRPPVTCTPWGSWQRYNGPRTAYADCVRGPTRIRKANRVRRLPSTGL